MGKDGHEKYMRTGFAFLRGPRADFLTADMTAIDSPENGHSGPELSIFLLLWFHFIGERMISYLIFMQKSIRMF